MELVNIFLYISLPSALLGLSFLFEREELYYVGLGASVYCLYLLYGNIPLGLYFYPVFLFIFFFNFLFKPFKTIQEVLILRRLLKHNAWISSMVL